MVTKFPRFSNALKTFRDEEDASLSVELVLILPLLIWGFLTVIAVYDTFRTRSLAVTANYAISDLLSRETNSIDNTYFDGVHRVFNYMTQGGSNTMLRVTQVFCVSDCTDPNSRLLASDWSESSEGWTSLTSQQINASIGNAIPLLAQGQRAVVVETSVDYNAPFLPPMLTTLGRDSKFDHQWDFLKRNTFRDIVITQPRFGSQLCWSNVNGCPPA